MGSSLRSINRGGFREARSCAPPGPSLALEAAARGRMLLQINPDATSCPGCLFSKAPLAHTLPGRGWGPVSGNHGVRGQTSPLQPLACRTNRLAFLPSHFGSSFPPPLPEWRWGGHPAETHHPEPEPLCRLGWGTGGIWKAPSAPLPGQNGSTAQQMEVRP